MSTEFPHVFVWFHYWMYQQTVTSCVASEPPTIIPDLTCSTGNGKAYRGTIAVTLSGKKCQRWSAQTPHEHSYSPGNYLCEGLENNYCRNPDSWDMPWCYTTDPNTRWEFCNVPNCENIPRTEECLHCNGEDYRGIVSTTENGFTCQRWQAQRPHSHTYLPNFYPESHLEENYCRNPSGDPRPWCYTTNSSKRWDYCSIPRCTSEPPTIVPELSCATGEGRAYRGTIAVTESGRTCQSWSSQTPHTHNYTSENYSCKGLDGNYCCNPDMKIMPWCYTTDLDTRWEYCSVPSCGSAPKTEECMHCTGENYRGKISTTRLGFTCQRWDSQYPQSHDYTPSDYPESHLEENYCRNPSGDPRPWCYTTDPSKRWDYCSIPRCKSEPPTIVPELTCATGKGQAYRGTIAVTYSGKTCKRWSHTEKHRPEDYPCKGLDSNYCRNPDNSHMPWCYTMQRYPMWEYCNVTSCGNSSGTDAS